MTGTKVAYIRVSSVEQNLEQQKELLEKYGIDRWYEEKASAKDTNRPKFQEMMDWVREGDTIYIRDFSRLARSTQDLLNITTELKEKGVKLVSDKENIDSSTPHGELMLTMIGAINAFERANMLERQKEGIAIAKQKGVYKGRKQIDFPSNWNNVYKQWKSREMTAKQAMEELGLKRTTFYKLVKEYEEQQ
ncbi:recombinase family protein [Bacillus paranthracis]|uniref:recombinase family protein n=2 Tax=Bacillus paranthracis TaxID=2026186 RepID=UPI001582A110|nr:recombinase family protein [Bacillus paranthracis]NUJ09871.1 recombinase family protein [Bacillus paranthracis]NUJ09878.1 recombinase family protein [Bacillus paranthracis]